VQVNVGEVAHHDHGRWVRLGVTAAAATVLLLFPVGPAIELVDGRSGNRLFCSHVEVGREVVLSFTHSVNRRPVYDTLRVERDGLVIVRSRFDAFGAGMPEATTEEGTLRIGPDGWLEWTINRPVPEITLRVGWVADHQLEIGERRLRLADLAEPGSPVTIRTRSVRLLDILKGRCLW
jgi:hypothetical protein